MSRFRRQPPAKEPGTNMIVVTEGEKTEPGYLKAFKEIHVLPHIKKSVFKLRIIPGIGVPKTVVDRAIQELEDLQGPLSGKDSVWAMFDRDEHPEFREAKDKARSKGVHLAISNPCFEIWGIYHYQDWQGPIERDQCQKELERLCPSYNRKSGKVFIDHDAIKNKYRDAMRRAKESLDSRKREGDPEGNPSTSVYLLMEEILSKVEELKRQNEEPCQAIEGL